MTLRPNGARSLTTGLLAVYLLLTTGCGLGTGGRVAVQGRVTLDGQPVDGGVIDFVPVGGDTRANARIANGHYSIPAKVGPKPGTYRVEIRWDQKTGKQVPMKSDPPNTMDETRQVIPPEYNTRSKLTVEVPPGGKPFDFDLHSK
jgi:hypothetical protein